MQLLRMRNGEHQCLVYSLAMILDETPEALIQELGHDGTEEWFPKWEPPFSYRGYHIQEIIDLCLVRDIALVPIEAHPKTASSNDPDAWLRLWDYQMAASRFKIMIANKKGLLITNTHACAWDGAIAYDPNGYKRKLESLAAIECWLCHHIRK